MRNLDCLRHDPLADVRVLVRVGVAVGVHVTRRTLVGVAVGVRTVVDQKVGVGAKTAAVQLVPHNPKTAADGTEFLENCGLKKKFK